MVFTFFTSSLMFETFYLKAVSVRNMVRYLMGMFRNVFPFGVWKIHRMALAHMLSDDHYHSSGVPCAADNQCFVCQANNDPNLNQKAKNKNKSEKTFKRRVQIKSNPILDVRSNRYCSNGEAGILSLSPAMYSGISSLDMMPFRRLSNSSVDRFILFR